jgi:superfamily II DNA/RNA helicase
MYGNPDSITRYKVILLLDSFAEAYLKVLNDNELGVCRIIIDEIDIMDKFVCSSVQTKFVWLMSASYKDQKQLGPYYIGDHTKVVCKCDMEFVKKSLNLPEVKSRTIECNDDHIQLFTNIVDDKQIKALNAGDHNILNRIMNKSGLITPILYKDFVNKYTEYLLQKADLLPEAEKELERFIITDELTEKEYNILRDRVTLLKKFKHNALLLSERLQIVTDTFLDSCKETHLEGEFIEKMESDKTSKWLIFNDNGNVLIRYQELLLKRGVKAVMLDGGNQKLIAKTLKDYKEGDVQVLLLNSMIEGAGMNLENTTYLLFMHKTEEKFIEQVMGRAQRYGRKDPLNVIMLFNNNLCFSYKLKSHK